MEGNSLSGWVLLESLSHSHSLWDMHDKFELRTCSGNLTIRHEKMLVGGESGWVWARRWGVSLNPVPLSHACLGGMSGRGVEVTIDGTCYC